MSKFRTRRVMRLLVTAAAAIGVIALPAVPAHATYGPQFGTVHWQLLNSNGNQLIGSIDGTVEFDDGNTMFRYSLTMCRQNSFTAPYAYVYVNGTYAFPLYPAYTGLPACGGASALGGVVTGEVVPGGVVRNVTVEFHGSYYGSGSNGYPLWEQRQRSILKDNPYN
ncbi:hypothetical protein AB0K00_35245 [Dactylosporangium sp. NPDC049525]|uniref:hypothetical protein n=1 Tax=Dactylosporangium sp. NPDC049525 TaxID=3154730 RepID=UPI00343B4368